MGFESMEGDGYSEFYGESNRDLYIRQLEHRKKRLAANGLADCIGDVYSKGSNLPPNALSPLIVSHCPATGVIGFINYAGQILYLHESLFEKIIDEIENDEDWGILPPFWKNN